MSTAVRFVVIAITTLCGFIGGRVVGEFVADDAYPKQHGKSDLEQSGKAAVMIISFEAAGAAVAAIIAEWARLRRLRVRTAPATPSRRRWSLGLVLGLLLGICAGALLSKTDVVYWNTPESFQERALGRIAVAVCGFVGALLGLVVDVLLARRRRNRLPEDPPATQADRP